jgi:hypothetical protein
MHRTSLDWHFACQRGCLFTAGASLQIFLDLEHRSAVFVARVATSTVGQDEVNVNCCYATLATAFFKQHSCVKLCADVGPCASSCH